MRMDQNGTWEMESNDNFEGYLKSLDFDFATCKTAMRLAQIKTINQYTYNFKRKTNSTFHNSALDFTVGMEFDEYTKGLDNPNV